MIEQIKTFLETAVAPAPNSSTIQKVHAGADLLYQMDQVSIEISYYMAKSFDNV